MNEKIVLLMEETGCEQGEAQLALEMSNYDFEKAIQTIKSFLRNIAVVKGKFFIPDKNLYGLFVSIFHRKTESQIKFTGIVSYNPVVYEMDVNTDWHIIEKAIYSYRLLGGSIQSVTREFELNFARNILLNKDRFYRAVAADNEKVREIICENFLWKGADIQIIVQEINLAQYQQSPVVDVSVSPVDVSGVDRDAKCLVIETNLFESDSGKKAEGLLKGDVVFARICDDRDIAHYIARLLGIKDTEYMPVHVEDVEKDGGEVTLKLLFTPGIIGYTKVKSCVRIKSSSEGRPDAKGPFWRRIFGRNSLIFY
ncbi:MAG: hypothetical protein KJ967_00400 [Elusimicrobia bacterium]|nr:hypothetical protein [Elusimicrobiota bacterium]